MKITLLILTIISGITINAQNIKHENFGQMFKTDKFIMGKNIIKGEVGMGTGLVTYQPQLGELINYYRLTTNINLDIIPFPKQHFHIKTQFFIDLLKNEKTPPYLSNMYYQIGWYNWKSKTFSFGIENYSPNKFSKGTNWGTNLKRSFTFVSFNYDFLKDKSKLKIDKTTQIRVTPFVRYYYEYSDKYGIETGGHHKVVLGSSLRWTLVKKFYVEGAVYFYPVKNSRLPWDPDFTYGFGYFDWKAFRVNVSYGNWIANRFPWDKKEMKHNFLNGELRVMFSWSL